MVMAVRDAVLDTILDAAGDPVYDVVTISGS